VGYLYGNRAGCECDSGGKGVIFLYGCVSLCGCGSSRFQSFLFFMVWLRGGILWSSWRYCDDYDMEIWSRRHHLLS
jgi:hypothetical protein